MKFLLEKIMENTLLRTLILFLVGLTLILLCFLAAYSGICEIASGNTGIIYQILIFFILVFLIIASAIHSIWKNFRKKN